MSKGTVNKVIVMGRLGSDVELRATATGNPVANITVATNSISGSGDNRKEETEWHRVTLFGNSADIAHQYLSKGSWVYIEGRLQTRKWQDQNGQDRYTTEIVANEMNLIGGRNDTQGHGKGQGTGQAQGRHQKRQPMAQRQTMQPMPQRQPMPPQGFNDWSNSNSY